MRENEGRRCWAPWSNSSCAHQPAIRIEPKYLGSIASYTPPSEGGTDYFLTCPTCPRDLSNPITPLSFPQDRHEIFAYIVETRSFPLGAVNLPVFGFTSSFDLRSSLNYDVSPYSHSKQFRSNLPSEWNYWKRFIDDTGL